VKKELSEHEKDEEIEEEMEVDKDQHAVAIIDLI